jgi:hypothetical protein
VKKIMNTGLDNLLALDGVIFVVDVNSGHWVKFIAKQVPESQQRPNGIHYSLTLHAANGERLIGYDNAHTINIGSGPSRRKSEVNDHKHRYEATKLYQFIDAQTLLQDFWTDVDLILFERGVKP